MSASKLGDITLTKKSGTVLTLNTEGKYIPDDKYFNIAVRDGAGTVTIASTDAAVESDASTRNISGVVGTKSTTAPSQGYYLKVAATGNGSSSITTAGWLDTGTIGTATATGSFYFPIDTATATVSGVNTVTPSASLSGSNVSLSNTNNGISITAAGGGTAVANVSASSVNAGYMPANTNLDTESIYSSSASTAASSYLSGVTIPIPSSGTNSFSVTLPNGNNDTLTLTFVVSSDGSWSIE